MVLNIFYFLFAEGGLGDVVGALPKALARRGHRVMVHHSPPWQITVLQVSLAIYIVSMRAFVNIGIGLSKVACFRMTPSWLRI